MESGREPTGQVVLNALALVFSSMADVTRIEQVQTSRPEGFLSDGVQIVAGALTKVSDVPVDNLRDGDLEGLADVLVGRVKTASTFEEFVRRLLSEHEAPVANARD